uniref:Uncharacterized protein n=1 Tax=Brassica campestris TaxID=3711 RepID=A0A3P6BLM9_BRACM|nr:unnamed protein product [Brassica rapa]
MVICDVKTLWQIVMRIKSHGFGIAHIHCDVSLVISLRMFILRFLEIGSLF